MLLKLAVAAVLGFALPGMQASGQSLKSAPAVEGSGCAKDQAAWTSLASSKDLVALRSFRDKLFPTCKALAGKIDTRIAAVVSENTASAAAAERARIAAEQRRAIETRMAEERAAADAAAAAERERERSRIAAIKAAVEQTGLTKGVFGSVTYTKKLGWHLEGGRQCEQSGGELFHVSEGNLVVRRWANGSLSSTSFPIESVAGNVIVLGVGQYNSGRFTLTVRGDEVFETDGRFIYPNRGDQPTHRRCPN